MPIIMYTRAKFGKELKKKVRQRIDVVEIGSWAYEMYTHNILDHDPDLENILLILSSMEDGPEYAMSYERLNEIADDLISGKKDVNMDY